MPQTMGIDNNDLLTGNNQTNNTTTKTKSNSPNTSNNEDDDGDGVTSDGIKKTINNNNNNSKVILINAENCDNLINQNNNHKTKVKFFNEPTTVTSDTDVSIKIEKIDSIIKNEEINENETLTIVISTEIVEDNNNTKYGVGDTYPTTTTAATTDAATSSTITVTTITTSTTTSIPTSTVSNQICDSSLDSATVNVDNFSELNYVKTGKSKLRSILGGSPEKQRLLLRKKSVSFDTDEETVNKFISGEEIVDKQNPFRHPVSLIEQENGPTYKLIKNYKYNRPVIPKYQPRSTKLVDFASTKKVNEDEVVEKEEEEVADQDEFISKEEILNQSKYVPTYIKNPDKVFTYDKSVLEKYERTLLAKKKLVPQKKSPVPCPRRSKLPQFNESLVRKSNKKSTKNTNPNVKYPDLSDLKIKTGTDLEESLYDPDEVANNVRKFDNRFRAVSLGSQDDLDEISDLTSDKINNNEETVVDETDNSNLAKPTKVKITEDEPKKSLTNTVNSFEFREFLKRKGLSLVPLKSNGTNGITNSSVSKATNGSLFNNSNSTPASLIIQTNNQYEEDDDMDGKSEKKRSMLRRIFPSGLFSMKSKTSPKENASPQPLLITKKPLLKESNLRDTGSLKRVILDRAGSHSATSSRSSIPANNEFTKQFSLRERSSKYKNADDDRGSSISSVLTAADYCDVNAMPSLPIAKNSLDRSEAFRRDKRPSLTSQSGEKQIPKKSSYVPVYRNVDSSRSRLYSSKLRAPVLINKTSSEQPLSFKNESPNLSDGVVKPKVHRPTQQVSSSHDLPSNGGLTLLHQSQNKPPPVPLRRSSERSSLIVYRKPDGPEIIPPMMNRSISLDREMTKKKNRPPELPQRNYLVEAQYSKQLTRLPVNTVNSQVTLNKMPIYSQDLPSERFVTPTTSNEKLLEANVKNTSTPISEGMNQSKMDKSIDISSIANVSKKLEPRSQELDPYLYIKLHEMKKKTDSELYIKAQQEMQIRNNNIYGKPKMVERRGSLPTETMTDNIYESTERMSQQMNLPQQIYLNANSYQNSHFVRNSPQRNTIEGIIRSGNSRTMQNLNRYLQSGQQSSSNLPINNRLHSLQLSEVSVHQPPQPQQALPSQHPPMRSQSVLDGMTYSDNQRMYGSIENRQGQNATPVVMRKGGTLDKKQILKEIYEFYRRSVNSTPTKMKMSVVDGRSAPSPISYASLSSSRLANENANTIPRAQSVTADYASIGRREMMQQQIEMKRQAMNENLFAQKRVSFTQEAPSNHTRAQTLSDSDSVFLPSSPRKVSTPIIEVTPPQQQTSEETQTSALQQKTIRQPFYSQEFQQQIYGRIAAKNSSKNQESPYGFVLARTNQNGQIYGYTRPSSALPTSSDYYLMMQQQKNLQKNLTTMQSGPLTPNRQIQHPYYDRQQAASSRVMLDGRSTPLVLHAIASQPTNKSLPKSEMAYRPIRLSQQQQQMQTRNIQQLRNQSNNRSAVNSQEYLGSDNVLYKLKPTGRLLADSFDSATNNGGTYHYPIYESESGSEAGEVQRILQNRQKEDWQNDKSGKNQQNDQALDDRRRGIRSRDDPRRHTLGGDMLHYGQGGHGGQSAPLQRSMDLEAPPARGYVPTSQGPLFDDDPGIMSEVETASTGFRRGGKQRSSLPVVRTPSKTLERPLGLVFLQYRSETKRALLPNEITSIDTVRALFVRSFPRQLTMAYLEGPNVKIYIHDSSKDMFYELEDVRSHLREIRDRSVLRLFESNEVAAPHVLPGGPGVPQPLPQQGGGGGNGGGHWEDQSYFSEPEFDTEYQHQHVHKNKTGKGGAPYYVGAAQTLPRGGIYTERNKNSAGVPAKPLRSYGSRGSMGPQFPYPPDQLYSIPDGYMSSPERGTRGAYEEPYYSQYGTRNSSTTPIIDEEQSDASLADDQYSMYGVKVSGRIPRNSNQLYDPSRPEDLHRIRVEHMERQLANLTGLVQKALTQNPPAAPVVNTNFLGVPGQYRGGGDKSVSFEKSVSFSDDIHGVPKSHSPQHLERDRLKPPPPPKPMALATTNQYRAEITLAPEVYNHLRGLQKKAKDLRTEVRTLRRLAQTQTVAVREDIKDTFMRIRATLLSGTGNYFGQGDQERTRISREEEVYKQEVIRLEKDLADLESSVEVLRGEVINRRTRVNMAAVEDMALVLSRASKTVAELKIKFPSLHQNLRNILANEMDQVCREEKFLKDEPDRLESALRRCKKLTGTLVTLKRLASVQEQRLPCAEPQSDEAPRSAESTASNKPIPSPRMGTVTLSGGVAPENALDALLDELQTFAKPPSGEHRPDDSTTSDDSSQTLQNTVTTKISQSSLYPIDPNASNNIGLRRLHSYPSGSDTNSDTTSPPQQQRPTGKPPVPERNADLLSKVNNKRVPPPPPPRTSSRSPLASPTSPHLQRMPSLCESNIEQQYNNNHQSSVTGSNNNNNDQGNNSSGESVASDNSQRQMALELRHQELLKKQKQLQEQYQRLQQMSKNSLPMAPGESLIKKTGSESNLPQKMGLNMSIGSGSMKNLAGDNNNLSLETQKNEKNSETTTTTTSKVYETDIL